MNITIDYKCCYKECPKQCKQIYIKSNVKASIDNFLGDSYLKIKKYHGRLFSYQAENELSLIKYFADLGGLFGLYLGISFVHFGTLINQLINYMKKLLNYCMNYKIFKIIIRLRKNLQKLNFILNHIQLIDFTLVSKLIFPPILIYQMFTMFNLYFKYSTQTNYNFILYNISDNKYSVNEFPAITVCNDLLFDKIWFNDYYDPELIDFNYLRLFNEDQAKSDERDITNCKQFHPFISNINKHGTNEHVKFSLFNIIETYVKYYENKYKDEEDFDDIFCPKLLNMWHFILNNLMANDQNQFQKRMLRFEDKHTYGLNSTKQLFDFYRDHFSCITNDPSIHCSRFGQNLSLLSPLGKCHTFLYNNDINQTHVKSIKILMNLFLRGSPYSDLIYPNYLSFRVLLHEKNSMPDRGSIEIIPFFNYMFQSYDMNMELKKTVIKKLEKPYHTECHDYGESNQINCLNSCYIKMYQDAFDCSPNSYNYQTIILNYIHGDNEKNLFCPNYLNNNITKFERKLNYFCNQMCGSSCHEISHDVEIGLSEPSSEKLIINFYSNDTTYKSIEYVPKISIIEFFINLFNIWNLWHGTSLITILVIFANFSRKISRFFPSRTNCLNTRILIKIISSILLLLFIGKIISLTMDYLRFDTITKINLLDYEDDDNYPYLSFTLDEGIFKFMINLANFKSNFTMLPKEKFKEYN